MAVKPPDLPNVKDVGEMVNASPSDFRAILIFAGFLIAMVFGMWVWREVMSWRQVKSLDNLKTALAGSLDGMTSALAALRLTIETAIVRGEAREQERDRWERRTSQDQGQQNDRLDQQGRRQDTQGERQDRQGARQDRTDSQ